VALPRWSNWECDVIDRIYAVRAARWAIAGAIVLAVGVAGAATKLKHSPATGDACLCTPDTQMSADGGANLDPQNTASYSARGGVAIPAGSNTKAGPLVAQGLMATTEYNGSAGSSAARSGGVGWGSSFRHFGAYSSGGSGHGAAFGGLWRLMNMSRRNAPSPRAASARASSPKAAKVSKPKPPRAGGSSSGGSLSAPVTTVAANDLFDEDATSIGDLLSPGAAIAPGTSGGGGSLDPRGLAHTPEPASMLLLAGGLAAVLKRRRRSRP
jgi:hypothetical protein